MERCSHGNLTIRAMLTLVECSACSMITHFDYTKFTPGDGYMECLKMQCFEMGTNILTEIWGEFGIFWGLFEGCFGQICRKWS